MTTAVRMMDAIPQAIKAALAILNSYQAKYNGWVGLGFAERA